MSNAVQANARGILRGRPRSPSTIPASAAPALSLTGEAQGERGILLARKLSGESALLTVEGHVVLSLDRLSRHMLVCGATGAGKTETLLRIAWTIAKSAKAPVFYLDGKGDTRTAERFTALMADAGRSTRVFPHEPFDGWRGEPHELHGRLMEIIDYAETGPASWYRDLAKTVLHLVCQHPDGPPRNSTQLLARLDLEHLQSAHGAGSAAGSLTREHVRQVRLRYQAFFLQARGALDGAWAWEDTQAAYLLLDTLALKDETAGLSRLLFEDFAHYFTHRKPHDRFALLIVDEFAALATNSGMAQRVEQARGFNTGLILAPQVAAGLGDPAEAERITGSVETIVCHRVNTPETIIGLAGTKLAPEYSTHYGPDGASTGEGSSRIQHQYKIDPNQVRSLPPGVVYIINQGQAMRAEILRAPAGRMTIPRANAATSLERAPSVDEAEDYTPSAFVDALRF
ncbi:MAG: helicase HerA-like domain-containing protein [Solirubrobacteraceae bacterium]